MTEKSVTDKRPDKNCQIRTFEYVVYKYCMKKKLITECSHNICISKVSKC